MKTRTYVLVAFLIILALAATLAYAYGSGRGPRMAGPPAGCPRMGIGPAGGGAWWMTAQPKTPEEKAFIDKVRGLHEEIRTKQFELARLRNQKGTEKQIASLEKEIAKLRTQLHETLWNNRELAMKLGAGPGVGATPPGCGMWCKGYPGACDQCPFKDECPCYGKQAGKRIQGYVCPRMCAPYCNGAPGQCANCPYKDKCPCPYKGKPAAEVRQGPPAK